MSGRLVEYLYMHSHWIEEAFTGALLDKGTSMKYVLGDHSEILNRDDVQELQAQLNLIPVPVSMEIANELSNLKRMLGVVLTSSRYRIILSLG